MKEIPLTNSSLKVKIDDWAYESVKHAKWAIDHGKARLSGHRNLPYMHNILYGNNHPKFDVHHKNEEGLDNRIKNIELVPHVIHSRRHRKRKGKFGYRTTLYKSNNMQGNGRCWGARIRYKGKSIKLGVYEDPYSANLVYEIVRKELEKIKKV